MTFPLLSYNVQDSQMQASQILLSIFFQTKEDIYSKFTLLSCLTPDIYYLLLLF